MSEHPGKADLESLVAEMASQQNAIVSRSLVECIASLVFNLESRLEKAEAERDQLVEQQIAAVEDLQTARNDALAGAQDYLRRLPSFGDGKWAANHLEVLKSSPPPPDQGDEA